MELAAGTAPSLAALRSCLQGYVPRSALPGGCSSEPPPRWALQPSLYLGTCSFERFPKRLLLGGTTAGHAHECPPKWTLLGGAIAGLAHGCLPKGLLLGGTTTEAALLENSSWYGSSEPLLEALSLSISLVPCSAERFPWQRLFGASTEGFAPPRFPLAAPPRRNYRGTPSPSASQGGSSSEEPSRVSLMGVFQSGSSSEGPRRVFIHRRTPKAGSSESSQGFSSPGLLLEACL